MNLDFESIFFDQTVKETLFYSPKIEIKPVHLANGLFRAVCGKYAEALDQHIAIYPKAYPNSNVNEQIRGVLNNILSADGALFARMHMSSYTLSHVSHITNDNHDRRTGEWLSTILKHDSGEGRSPALELLYTLLNQDNRQRSDEISTLTLPLTRSSFELKDFKPQMPDQHPSSLRVDEAGTFCDPLLYSIRKGFDRIAKHDRGKGNFGEKLDTLRRLVTWGCFSIYLHLANSGSLDRQNRAPMMLCMVESPSPTLRQASTQSYLWVGRSIDKFFRKAIRDRLNRIAEESAHGSWETDADIRQQIRTMTWKTSGGRMQQAEARLVNYTPQCLLFYDSYLRNQSPGAAFVNAAADMIDQILSSSPTVVAHSLGTRIGLLSPGPSSRKRYTVVPDLLEVLVRATIPPQEQWTIDELAHYWADHYGLLFGALGDENARLAEWGINAIDGSSLYENTDALATTLELSGYARRYADGVIFISVRE
jgi:hypothetical protein